MSEVENEADLRKSIIKTLLYYDIFQYPLKADEVYRYLDRNSITVNDVSAELKKMTVDELVFAHKEFYAIENNAELVDRRLRGNALAEKLLSKARKKARLISSFPFVRAVLASGSLSKGYMDESSDFDFFIIAARNRVWIARMLLVFYKVIFLGNSHKHFCINYFIDEGHLEIEEKNVFTATELASILPLCNPSAYLRLIQLNDQWLKKFFPNYKLRSTEAIEPVSNGGLKKAIEILIDALGAFVWEKLFMRVTLWYWRKRYWKKYSAEDFELAFKSRNYVSKNHPQNFQKKVINELSSKMQAFEMEHVRSEI